MLKVRLCARSSNIFHVHKNPGFKVNLPIHKDKSLEKDATSEKGLYPLFISPTSVLTLWA